MPEHDSKIGASGTLQFATLGYSERIGDTTSLGGSSLHFRGGNDVTVIEEAHCPTGLRVLVRLSDEVRGGTWMAWKDADAIDWDKDEGDASCDGRGSANRVEGRTCCEGATQ